MEFPDDVQVHERARVGAASKTTAPSTIGITDYAQEQLGDIVFVELPEAAEDPVPKDEPFAVVESVKAVSDVYAPISGKRHRGQRRAPEQSRGDQRGSLR